MPNSDSSSGSRQYRLTRRLSSNALSISWVGRRVSDGEICFVKSMNPESDLEASVQYAVLAESCRCQSGIGHPRIATAINVERGHGRLFIEYPYLAPEEWKPLDPAVLAAHASTLLPEIALIVDYLHHVGFVHRDLKLSNFMMRQEHEGIALRLVDLDFLCPAGTHSNARRLGTPGFIAPEIERNDEVSRQSDTYSLGRALAGAIENAPWDKPTADALRRLVADMILDDPFLRPRSLTSALAACELIDKGTQSDLNRRLMASVLVTRFSKADRKALTDSQRLNTLLSDAGLLGVDPVVIDLTAAVYAMNRRKGFHMFAEYVRHATVNLTADYFSVSCSDDFLLPFLNKAGAQVGAETVPGDASPADVLELARRFERADRRLWGYLALKRAVDTAAADRRRDKSDLIDSWYTLGELAVTLGRSEESITYRLKFADAIDSTDPRRFAVLYQVARLYFMTMRLKEGEALTDELLSDAVSRADVVQEVTVRRLRAMIDSSQGRYDTDELIRKTIAEVADRIPPVELALSHYNVASVFLRRSQLVEALDHAMRALKLVRLAGASDRLVMVLLALISILQELGDSRRARHYALVGIRLRRRMGELHYDPNLLAPLVISTGRLGYRQEAEYWESRLLAQFRRIGDFRTILAIANSLGFSRLQRGDLRGAREMFALIVDEHGVEIHRDLRYKALYNLAECALWQGEPDLCDRYADEARSMMQQVGSELSLLELKLFTVLNAIYNRNQRDLKPLHDLLQPFLERNDAYCGLHCAFHLILLDPEARGNVARTVAPMLEPLAGSAVPLHRAMEHLLPPLLARRLESAAFLMELKEAFRYFVKGGQKFLAAVTGKAIASQYLTDGRDALGVKYLAQVERLAVSLDNQRLCTEVNNRIAQHHKSTDSHRRLIHSIHGISQVLRNMEDYEDSLGRLVEFAVNETGAERGALLLRTPRNSEFYVASYYNCDEGSLGDITDISSRVPMDASNEREPLIIDDATADARTKEYKSVIEHNILSVICVPIVRDGETVGALYLDHHTIPALFEQDDITYITAIANFMALVISSLRQVRSAAIINREMLADLNPRDGGVQFITNDPATLEMLQPLNEIALSDRPVLILGESGTGKEVLARKIHDRSRRAGRPFVQFNCTAFPETMIESELFGIVRGAATGVAEREGRFMAADTGTLFFDEIGDMSLTMQAKILTAVETHRFERIGSNRTVYADVRFIYATNKDVPEMVKQQTFREDLYYRMNFFTVEIPPLRTRRNDIPLLIDHFIRNMSREAPAPRFSRTALEALIAYEWPGNVRELKNLVERFCLVHSGKEIGVNLLPRDIQNVRSGGSYAREAADAAEKERMRAALAKRNGIISAAARDLGMPLSTFRRKAKKYGLL